MLTLKEYDKAIDNLKVAAYKNECFDEVYEFQHKHMQEYYDYYVSKAEKETEKYACEILEYLISDSQSGSVVHYVESEEKANELRDYLNQHEFYGEIMLDSPEVYYCEYCNEWVVDCMFGGNYCPWWDGWFD